MVVLPGTFLCMGFLFSWKRPLDRLPVPTITLTHWMALQPNQVRTSALTWGCPHLFPC